MLGRVVVIVGCGRRYGRYVGLVGVALLLGWLVWVAHMEGECCRARLGHGCSSLQGGSRCCQWWCGRGVVDRVVLIGLPVLWGGWCWCGFMGVPMGSLGVVPWRGRSGGSVIGAGGWCGVVFWCCGVRGGVNIR